MSIAAWMGWLVVAVWMYILLGRGFFWILREPRRSESSGRAIRVAAIVPARNEAEVVGRAIASLTNQTLQPRVFLVDDHSTDGTVEAAGKSEHLTIVTARSLESGWTGKLWAMSEGVAAAEAAGSFDYYLFTDADIVHSPSSVAELVARAEEGRYDIVSLMVELSQKSLAERALIPAFVFFFFMLYPPRWGTGAAGGCLLIRPEILRTSGGLAGIKGNLIDDCALAAQVRRVGGRIFLAPTRSIVSIREYATFAEIGRMISRTAFTQLRYSWLLLAGSVLGLTLVYVAPVFLGVTLGVLGWIAWALMALCYYPTLRFYGRSPLWAPLMPLIAIFYMGATLHSAFRGSVWKGRSRT